jgi:hypothetical protein
MQLRHNLWRKLKTKLRNKLLRKFPSMNAAFFGLTRRKSFSFGVLGVMLNR